MCGRARLTPRRAACSAPTARREPRPQEAVDCRRAQKPMPTRGASPHAEQREEGDGQGVEELAKFHHVRMRPKRSAPRTLRQSGTGFCHPSLTLPSRGGDRRGHFLRKGRFSLHQAAGCCGGTGAQHEHGVSKGATAAHGCAGFDRGDLEAEVAGGGWALAFLRGPSVKRRGRRFGSGGIEQAVEHGGVSPWREEWTCGRDALEPRRFGLSPTLRLAFPRVVLSNPFRGDCT